MANVLIVDDDVDTAETLAEVIATEGHEVRLAQNGQQGLAQVEVREPDVIFLDLEMPVLDGPKMAARMVAHNFGQEKIPIVLISGSPQLRAAAAQVGTPYFLSKPTALEAVLRVLERALDERIAPAPSRKGSSHEGRCSEEGRTRETSAMTTAHLERAGKVYGDGVKTRALAPTTLDIERGELTLLLGPSGSGKTTLLNLLGGLDQPSEGTVHVEGQELTSLDRRALTLFRRQHVGFVFQFFNLVPSLTARENVQLASELVHGAPTEADHWLSLVGLDGLADRFPSELSGGQQQRVAIARALAKRPKLLLADEPTGALDHETGGKVVGLLKSMASSQRCAVVIVTHDEDMIAQADRVIRLRDGAVVSDTRPATPRGAPP